VPPRRPRSGDSGGGAAALHNQRPLPLLPPATAGGAYQEPTCRQAVSTLGVGGDELQPRWPLRRQRCAGVDPAARRPDPALSTSDLRRALPQVVVVAGQRASKEATSAQAPGSAAAAQRCEAAVLWPRATR
jgi:hypothetical protein